MTNPRAACAFYQRVLGFERIDTPGRPTALAFGTQKINVHEVDRTFEPRWTLANFYFRRNNWDEFWKSGGKGIGFDWSSVPLAAAGLATTNAAMTTSARVRPPRRIQRRARQNSEPSRPKIP